MIARQLYALFFALDLLASALTGGAPGQSISARLAKATNAPAQVCRAWLDTLVRLVFRQPGHCALALANYEARQHAAPLWI
jgi:hypothetical protein